MKFQYKPAGDLSILVKVGNEINEEINEKVTGLSKLVEEMADVGFEEVIPGYNSLLISYNPLKISYDKALSILQKLEKKVENERLPLSRKIEIPVLYGGEWGPDLEDVAKHNGLRVEEVISIHSSTEYLVYFIGFTPGFPFLGGMSRKIATPRLPRPRVSIPAGSVGIANNQTGMYPVSSPGGWRLIGRTPLQLFSPQSEEQPFLLQPSDYVIFKQIDVESFRRIEEEVKKGIYEPRIIRSEQHESV
jgi:inhibitor of KinA